MTAELDQFGADRGIDGYHARGANCACGAGSGRRGFICALITDECGEVGLDLGVRRTPIRLRRDELVEIGD